MATSIRRIGAGMLLLVAALQPPRLAAAYCTSTTDKKEGYFTCIFGIEQWEEGKRSDSQHQQWTLQCSQNAREPTSCSLERTAFIQWSNERGLTTISIHKHSTDAKTLRVVEGDWRSGKLDFDVIYPDGSRAPVRMRLKKLDGSDTLLAIDSFDAFDTIRGVLSDSLVRVQYKIPEYGYVLNVPVSLDGKKTAEDKVRDDFNSDLSPEDREAWKLFQASKCMDGKLSDEQKLNARVKEQLPDINPDADDLTSEQRRRVADALGRIFAEEAPACLKEAGMSEKGQARTLKFFQELRPF